MSVCSETSYTTPNGLQFDIQCAQQFIGNVTALTSTNNDDMATCMDQCSLLRPRCYAIWFDKPNHTCYLLDKNHTAPNYITNKDINVALADKSQLRTPEDLSCPYPDHSHQTSQDGEEFEVLCGMDINTDADYCAYNLGPFDCPPHADTYADFMQYCSEAHPLCKGFAYNPGLEAGYGNCYLKYEATKQQAFAYPLFVTHGGVVKSASVVNEPRVECPQDRTYSSANGANFTIECYDSRYGSQNFTSAHKSSVRECMDSCSNTTDMGCIGVVFDSTLQDGWENCYLLNDTGVPNRPSDGISARLTESSASGSETQANRSGSGDRSKAWIAGPVIGAVVVLAILIGGFLWWRRRRRRSSNQQYPQHHFVEKQAADATYEAGGRQQRQMLYSNPGRYELRDPKSEAGLQHELES